MKFKRLVESEMITELSDDGKWVTFKNGQHTYVGKNGDIETGQLKGYNLNNKKAIKGKYKQIQDQSAKAQKKADKAKKREESKLTDFQKKNANDMLNAFADRARWEKYDAKGRQEVYDKARKGYADKLKAKKEAGQLNKNVATDKQWDTYMNRIEHYGEKSDSEKSQKKQQRKELERKAKPQTADTEKELSKALQGDIKGMRAKLKAGGEDAEEVRSFLKQAKEQGYDFRKASRKALQGIQGS